MSVAHLAGETAYCEGVRFEDNPFRKVLVPELRQVQDWDNGWLEAAELHASMMREQEDWEQYTDQYEADRACA